MFMTNIINEKSTTLRVFKSKNHIISAQLPNAQVITYNVYFEAFSH